MTSTAAFDLLGALGWSTSQGDAALDGALVADVGQPLDLCPWPTSSTLAHPWRAGWIATAAAALAPPTLAEARATGHVQVVMRAHQSARALAVFIHEPGGST